MPDPAALRDRLAQLIQALRRFPQALALVGIGSSGPESDRLDRYSDLDVFLVVRAGTKQTFLADLTWLDAIAPIAYAFRRTKDEYKVLFADGIFCEVGVFEPADLTTDAFAHGDWSAPGQVLWQTPEFDAAALASARPPAQPPQRTPAWLLGEALTNLYIGLGRYHRGEKLSAARFIQGYAVDRILELSPLLEQERAAHRDPYGPERRYEQRFPQTA